MSSVPQGIFPKTFSNCITDGVGLIWDEIVWVEVKSIFFHILSHKGQAYDKENSQQLFVLQLFKSLDLPRKQLSVSSRWEMNANKGWILSI